MWVSLNRYASHRYWQTHAKLSYHSLALPEPIKIGEKLMTNIQDLLAQKAALEKQIAEAQRAAKTDAIAKVKSLMTEYGLTAADLAGRTTTKVEGTRKVAAKYRDPETNQTWTGRGLKPKWLQAALAAGKSLTDFAI
jgi:DNA-binding protein H-NS